MNYPRSGRRQFMVAGAALAFASPAAAQEQRESFDVASPSPPRPVRIAGAWHLVYELHLTNFSGRRLRLRSLRVRDQSGAGIAEFPAEALAERTIVIGEGAVDHVGPGSRAVIYLELACVAAPDQLEHELRFAADAGDGSEESLSFTVAVGASAPIIGAPLAGGPWAAIYDARLPRGHRRVFYTLGGRARLPGRFAIDWVRVDEHGRIARGDADIASHHLGYGADVLAVSDGEIVALRDGVSESTSVSGNDAHGLDGAAGNYIALAIAPDTYAIYEHLRPGSLRVAPGDRVLRGQLIGGVGFSGDSTGPHLHFHLADRPAPLAGEGVPFAIDRFEVLGRYEELDRLGAARWTSRDRARPARREGERPEPNAVVRFE